MMMKMMVVMVMVMMTIMVVVVTMIICFIWGDSVAWLILCLLIMSLCSYEKAGRLASSRLHKARSRLELEMAGPPPQF